MASVATSIVCTPPHSRYCIDHSPENTSADFSRSYHDHHTNSGAVAGDTPSRNTSQSSPGTRSRSFSISDILSDEIGSRKRSSVSEIPGEIREKQIKIDVPPISPNCSSNLIPLGHAGRVVMSPVNMCVSLQPPTNLIHRTNAMAVAHQAQAGHVTSAAPVYPMSYQHPLQFISSPLSSASMEHSFNYHYSAFNPQFAAHMQQVLQSQMIGHPDMRTVIQHDSNNGRLQEQLANMRLQSQINDTSINSLTSETTCSSDENIAANRKPSTPSILKHDKRKKNTGLPPPNPQNTPTSIDTTPEGPRYLPRSQFPRSPLKPPNTTFSPSIFLTRPGISSSIPIPQSPHDTSSPDSTDGEREGGAIGSTNQFMTSTPIRRGERASFVSPSQLHSPIMSAGKRYEQTTSEYHSGNESEVPLLRRPRVPRKRTKTRTSLSPLLENTNPAATSVSTTRQTPSYPPLPSSLLTSYTALPPAGGNQNHSITDSGFISDVSLHRGPLPHPISNTHVPRVPTDNSPFLMQPFFNPYINPSNLYETPVKNVYGPHIVPTGMRYAAVWGSSPVTDHLNKTGQIQSVPPWFICSDKKSDGKRLRLTEAISKSILESPSQKPHQLPAEWQKFAYGQTDDQKDLTQKARNFMRCRPRVLQFERNTSQ